MTLTPARLATLRSTYRTGLLDSTVPFWLRHGLDREHGGLLSNLGEDGTLIDGDKALWLQGRAAWTFSTLHTSVEKNPAWLSAAKSCLDFIRQHGRAPDGKLYFTVTRDGRPIRMRRYVYSECFAAVGSAAYARAAGDERAAVEAVRYFETYLHHSFTPGVMPPKLDPVTRPLQGLAPHMIAIVTAQELRARLDDPVVAGTRCTEWIDRSLTAIERDFFKPDLGALMETVGPRGEIVDCFDGRTLNPGHALECAWFVLREAKHRQRDARLTALGLAILDCMWARGWDPLHGGLLYYTDVWGKPVQEYWADMKFWWPHNEAEIATLLAYQLTGNPKYAHWHGLVHEWSHRVFADPVHGEWFGYASREGRITTRLKGNTWKGPFHLPRMQLTCWGLVDELSASGPAGQHP
ncbi:MAG: AGE family epimerase/isomerase [Opitutaceae bacterium]|nr:AGE family epimerase/isomerase [Opitutaceae bacterium]